MNRSRVAALVVAALIPTAAVAVGVQSAVAAPAEQTVRQGSTGASVISAQALLRKKGYLVDTDGQFGPVTDRLTRDFQRDHGLAADGIIGPQTWAALKRPAANPCEKRLEQALPNYYMAQGWKIRCLPPSAFKNGIGGYTAFSEHVVALPNTYRTEQVPGALAHELAHVEASYFSERTKQRVTSFMKLPYWDGPNYFKQASEQYAENRAMCTGFRDPKEVTGGWTKYDCAAINRFAADNAAGR